MNGIFETIKGTPWWVFPLFAYLIWVGIGALKPQVVSLKKMFILPLVFLIWGIWGLIGSFDGYKDILIWIIFTVIGYFVGWGIYQIYRIRADKKKLLIKLPGTRFVLVFIILIFATRYFFGYYQATHLEMSPLIHAVNLVFSGMITGIFIGRSMALLHKFAKADHEKLKASNAK